MASCGLLGRSSLPTTRGAKPPIQPIYQPVDGPVAGAEAVDLSGNGQQEVERFAVK